MAIINRMKLTKTLAFGLFLTANLFAAPIGYQVSSLGGNLYMYSYSLTGLTLQANQEVDIRFDPALYGALSNGVAPSDYSLLLLQPNNPPGTFGDYSAFALVNNPSLAGPFSVDVIYKGSGTPGAQPYFINQYDANGNLSSIVTSGTTTPFGSVTVPEPGSFLLGMVALLIGASLWTIRRSRANSASRNIQIVL